MTLVRQEAALRLLGQGWCGLLPILPYDARPHLRLTDVKKQALGSAAGKAPGSWSCSGWSLLADWPHHPDDAATVARWARWPGVGVGARACHVAAPWVAFLDADVLHPEASAEVHDLLRKRLGTGIIRRIGLAPKFLVPVRVPEPVRKMRSDVVEIDGQRHLVEVLGQGQQAVLLGVHPKTMRPYAWPEGGPEDTEPSQLPLVTAEGLRQLLAACGAILRRYGPAVGRKGPIGGREESDEAPGGGEAKGRPRHELRARDLTSAMSAARFVPNRDWAYDDWIDWAYALRGAFGTAGEELWLGFSAESAKHDPATTRKVWDDVTRAERAGTLRSGAGTVIAVAKEEGWTPPPPPGLPPYFPGGAAEPDEAHSDLERAVARWAQEALAYDHRAGGVPPRDAIAGAVGLGKTTVTLTILAALAQGKTVHFYAPTLELAAKVVENARALGAPAVLVRGRGESKKDPERWPALCAKNEVAEILGRPWARACGAACAGCGTSTATSKSASTSVAALTWVSSRGSRAS